MPVDTLTEHRAIELNAAQLANAVTKCFEGYIMAFELDAAGFENRFRPEGLDSQASIILQNGYEPAAICLVARQGWTSRVAAMAIAPDFRRQGLGRKLMSTVIEEARTRGDKRMVLEVIEQNPAAIGLYENVGMSITRRLVGYRREAGSGIEGPLQEVDPITVIRLATTESEADLPWDYKPETLIFKGQTIGLSLEDRAFALVTNAPERIIIWTLFTLRQARGKGYAKKLIEAIAARYPEQRVVTSIAFPDNLFPEFYAKTGFTVPDITQFEMAIEF